MIQPLIRLTRHLFLFSLIAIAIILTVIRLIVFCIDLYKHELEYKLSELLETPVKIGHLSSTMYRLHPEIILKNISLAGNNPQQTAMTLKELRLGIDLVDILIKQQFVAATHITLVGAKLSVIRKKDGSFSIVGLKSGGGQPLWILQGERYQLLDSEISWLDEKRNGEKLTFKHVDLSIKNNSSENRHQIHFLSQLPTQYGKSLQVSVEIQGNVFAANNLNGQVFVTGEGIQFSKLVTGELPLKLALEKGNGNFKLWGRVQKSTLSELSGEINAKNLSVQRADKKNLNFDALRGKFNWYKKQQNWQLDIQNLQTKTHKKNWQSTTFSVASKNQASTKLAAHIKKIDLQLLSRLNKFFIPLITEAPDWLNQLTVEGQLNDGLLFADLEEQHYALKANFEQLSVKNGVNFPQIKNLSGSIKGSEQQGHLTLNSHDATFNSQSLFRKPLSISKLTGEINWQQFCEQWEISSKTLQLDTSYLRSEHKLLLTIPKDKQSSFIDLQTAFYDINDVSKLKRYFPISSMGKETLGWLDRAFVSGKVKRGDMLLYGDLDDFPFNKKQGVFQVLFATQNLELAYAQQWPNFKALKADVMFLNEGLEVKVHHAKVGKASLNKTLVRIPSLEKSHYLLAKGVVKGTIIDTLNWLQQTPLDLSLKETLEHISVKGRTKIDVDLKIPLTENDTAKVTGKAELQQASLKVKAIDLPVTRIKGTLKFDEKHFYSDKLRAIAFGYPIQIKIKESPTALNINVSGKTSVKQLQKHFELPELAFAKGSSVYDLQLRLPSTNKENSTLRINSNLIGISSTLPSNLGKTAREKISLSVLLQINSQPLLPISVVYNKNLQAKLKLNKKHKKLHSGNILLGEGKLRFPSQQGLNIFVNQRSFSPLKWLSLLDETTAETNDNNLLRQIDIKTSHLKWQKQDLGALTLNLKRKKNNWLGTINSRFATGRLNLPTNTQHNPYQLNLDYIDLSALTNLNSSEENKKTTSQKKLPLITIQSKKLIWRGINLGRFDLSSQRQGNNIHFDRIRISNNKHTLNLTGQWKLLNNQHYTQLQGQLKAREFGSLLKNLDLSEELKETSADIKLALNWYAAPHKFSLETLNGDINLDLREGRISSIEPGFGRLLGVLAMGQWIKRLQLDFGDIYKEGLSFNSVTGHYNLQNGKAYSDDLIVDAIPAKITLKGELNLAAQTLSKEISVIPKSSAALPIAGTIVGSIATIIAQTVTGEYEEGFYLRTKYKVQGKWSDLKVIPLHEQDGLLQKTWRGLTDFSWINK